MKDISVKIIDIPSEETVSPFVVFGREVGKTTKSRLQQLVLVGAEDFDLSYPISVASLGNLPSYDFVPQKWSIFDAWQEYFEQVIYYAIINEVIKGNILITFYSVKQTVLSATKSDETFFVLQLAEGIDKDRKNWLEKIIITSILRNNELYEDLGLNAQLADIVDVIFARKSQDMNPGKSLAEQIALKNKELYPFVKIEKKILDLGREQVKIDIAEEERKKLQAAMTKIDEQDKYLREQQDELLNFMITLRLGIYSEVKNKTPRINFNNIPSLKGKK